MTDKLEKRLKRIEQELAETSDKVSSVRAAVILLLGEMLSDDPTIPMEIIRAFGHLVDVLRTDEAEHQHEGLPEAMADSAELDRHMRFAELLQQLTPDQQADILEQDLSTEEAISRMSQLLPQVKEALPPSIKPTLEGVADFIHSTLEQIRQEAAYTKFDEDNTILSLNQRLKDMLYHIDQVEPRYGSAFWEKIEFVRTSRTTIELTMVPAVAGDRMSDLMFLDDPDKGTIIEGTIKDDSGDLVVRGPSTIHVVMALSEMYSLRANN